MHCKGYLSGLTPLLFKIYSKKLIDFNLPDPYELPFSDFEENMDKWPNIDHGDLVYYLVFSTYTYTNEEMKAYKSLDCHNFFTSGRVNNHVLLKVLTEDKNLMLGEVKHSQSESKPVLKVWLLCKKDGQILTGHCTCMAGMGESCSHVAAFLFLLVAGTRFKEDTSCTDKKNAWLPPYQKNAQYLKIKEIDFESSTARYERTLCPNLKTMKKKKNLPKVDEPNDEELHAFFMQLHDAGQSSVVLTMVEPFNDVYATNTSMKELSNLFCSENTKLSWNELYTKCKEVMDKLVVTKSDAENIERDTKKQAKCKKWYTYRTGRITASSMKSVCNTDIEAPSVSTLKKICYPSLNKFSTVATEWGKQNEDIAKKIYVSQAEENHSSFKMSESGLHINPDFPFIAASPDGIVECDCCSNGIIEVKCPYTNRDSTITEISTQKKIVFD